MLVLLVVACQGMRPLGLPITPPRDLPLGIDPAPVSPEEQPRTFAAATYDGIRPLLPAMDPPAEEVCDPVDPGPPARPANVETVTVTARTASGDGDATLDDSVTLCLSGEHCLPLRQGSGVQLGLGAVGVWMFEGLSIPRADIDRVELRATDGEDRWQPLTVDIRLDGEPVYCSAIPGEGLGSDEVDVERWLDPQGLHQDCTSAWGERTLTHGPTVMAVGPDRAKIWVRTDATRAVEVRVWPAADPAAERAAGWVHPLAADDFTGSVEIGCLEPLTTYTYEVSVDGAPQGEHTFTTAPADGAPTTLRMAFGSCASGEQPIFGALDLHAPDLFAFVGDNHYANTDDLDSLRFWYRWSLERPERAAFLAHTPSLAIWDDHDFVGDDSDGSAPGKDRALRAFTEYQANPSAGLPGTPGVFFASRWGDIDLFFLDNRYWRGVDGDVLGAGQHDWLVSQLTASTGTFKLLIDGSQWTLEGDGDSWAQFPAARDELLWLIADRSIPGVMLLSGDIHHGEIRSIRAPAYDLPEITSSPLSQASNADCDQDSEELLACVANRNHWVTLAFDTTLADPEVVATFHGEDGAEITSHRWAASQLTP